MALFDAQIPGYLAAGGGLVSGGWTLYDTYPNGAPNIAAALPHAQAFGYVSGPQLVTPVGTHPIVTGVTSFSFTDYCPYGNGPKAGATPLIDVGTTAVGSAWSEQTNGRAVWLGPLFNEAYDTYANKNLLDGSQPGSVELLVRSIEWAGGWWQ